MMTALVYRQQLPRMTMPAATLTRLRFGKLPALRLFSGLQRIQIPTFPPVVAGNDAFLTANNEFLTSDGENLQW